MKCRNLSDWFEEYLNGTISQSDQQAFESHLQKCPHCRKQFELYRRCIEAKEIENDFSLPSDLKAKIKYTVFSEKQEKKIPFLKRKQTRAFAVACCLLLVAVGVGTARFDLWKVASNLQTDELVMLSGDDFSQKAVVVEDTAAGAAEQVQTEREEIQPEQKKTQEVPEPVQKLAKKPIPSARPTETPVVSAVLADAVAPDEIAVAEMPAEGPKTDSFEQPASGGEAESDEQTESVESCSYARNVPMAVAEPAPEDVDVTLDWKWKDILLGKYPFIKLSEEIYQVDITAEELGTELAVELEPNENKTSLIIRFQETISKE